VSIIGAQGAILGRGTQQVTPRVVRALGKENIIVVATPHKISQTPHLFIDTGDAELDREFGDSILVVTGYMIARRVRMEGVFRIEVFAEVFPDVTLLGQSILPGRRFFFQ